MRKTEPSHFDRQSAHAAWRLQLLTNGGMSPTQVDELYDHLQNIEQELDALLPPEEAFLVATHRIGEPTHLAEEYAKVTPNSGWLLRVQWAVIGLLVYWLGSPVASTIVYGLTAAIGTTFGPGTLTAALRLYAPLLSLALCVAGAILLIHRFALTPATVDRTLSLDNLSIRRLLPTISIAVVVWQLLFRYLGNWFLGVISAISPNSGPALLQSRLWSDVASMLEYLLPVVLFLTAIGLQRVRNKRTVTA